MVAKGEGRTIEGVLNWVVEVFGDVKISWVPNDGGAWRDRCENEEDQLESCRLWNELVGSRRVEKKTRVKKSVQFNSVYALDCFLKNRSK